MSFFGNDFTSGANAFMRRDNYGPENFRFNQDKSKPYVPGKGIKQTEWTPKTVIPYYNMLFWTQIIYMIWWLAIFVIVIALAASWVSFTSNKGYMILEPYNLVLLNGTNSSGIWDSSHFRSWPYPVNFLMMIPSGWAFLLYMTSVIMIGYGTEREKYLSIWTRRGYNIALWIRVAVVLIFINVALFMQMGQGDLGFDFFLSFVVLAYALFAFNQEYEEAVRHLVVGEDKAGAVAEKEGGESNEAVSRIRASIPEKKIEGMTPDDEMAIDHFRSIKWGNLTSMFIMGAAIFTMRWVYAGLANLSKGMNGYLWAASATLSAYEFMVAIIIWCGTARVIKNYALRLILYDVCFFVFITPTIFLITAPAWIARP
jgi:hypothetical protein